MASMDMKVDLQSELCRDVTYEPERQRGYTFGEVHASISSHNYKKKNEKKG